MLYYSDIPVQTHRLTAESKDDLIIKPWIPFAFHDFQSYAQHPKFLVIHGLLSVCLDLLIPPPKQLLVVILLFSKSLRIQKNVFIARCFTKYKAFNEAVRDGIKLDYKEIPGSGQSIFWYPD